MILEELIVITLDPSHLNLRLRFQFPYLLLGVLLVIMLAKYNLQLYKIRITKVSPLTGSSIKGNLIQGNLLAHKDNPYRDNLQPSPVPLSLTLGSLLVNWVSLMYNKANLVSSKVILLDK